MSNTAIKDPYFEQIYQHLIRKHGDKSISIDFQPTYAMLICDWDSYHLAITYRPSISFPNYGTYDVWLENNCYVIAKEQAIGTKFWERNGLHSQEEVIDYIRHKMRKDR